MIGVRIAAFVALLPIADVRGDDWPNWRGPNRDGHSAEHSGWANGRWLVDAPMWSARVGEGCTSPLVVDDRLYSLGWERDLDHVVCLDAAIGKQLWKQSYRCPRHGRHHLGDEDAYSGPTATPEYDPVTKLLYTLSADGDLICWDCADGGRRRWSVQLYDTYAAPRRPEVGKAGSRRDYGYITAPIVYGDWLIVAVGAKDGHLIAFDKGTGQQRWVSRSKEPAGHCGGLTPILVEGVPCIASLSLRKLLVIRLDSGMEGQTIAEFDWITDFGNNIASPAVHQNFVLITSNYNRNAMCKLRITLRGATRVWEAPVASGACTPVIHEGHVYWASAKVRCLDFETGKQKWEGGSFGSPGSCIITRDQKLIVWGEHGKLALVALAAESPDKYRELARLQRVTPAYSWPHVILGSRRLYCKDRDGNLKCFRLN